MSLPCSDQAIRPKKTKDATLPPGVEVLRCWCGSPCKVKESTEFSDKMGMRFFMCPNYEHDPPAASYPYVKPPSPPPLCPYYRWIDTEQPDWALREIEERSRRAWRRFHAGERREKAEALEKAERKRYLQEMQRKKDEAYARQEEEKRRRTEAREAERQRLKERARQAQAAEEAGDVTRVA